MTGPQDFMDIDDFTDEYFAQLPPLQAQGEQSISPLEAFSALADVATSKPLTDALAELHIQHLEQYCKGYDVIDDGITALRARHEQELAGLLETTGRNVAVVHSDTMASVIMRHKYEIEEALLEREELRLDLEQELRTEFTNFLTVSAKNMGGPNLSSFPKPMTCLIGYQLTVPCATVRVANPLRGVLLGARPKDPALSSIVLDVTPSAYLQQMLELGADVDRHREHLRRLASHRHSVLMMTDKSISLPRTAFPELLLNECKVAQVGEFGYRCCTNLWGANICLTTPPDAYSVSVDGFRKVIAFALSSSADMLSIALGADHLDEEVAAVVEGIAATQIDVGTGRLTHGWSTSLAAISSGQVEVMQSQPLQSANRQTFNLPLSIRLFIPATKGEGEMSSIKKIFHHALEGKGLEWFGE